MALRWSISEINAMGDTDRTKNNYYGLAKGRNTANFSTWSLCYKQINGFSGECHRVLDTNCILMTQSRLFCCLDLETILIQTPTQFNLPHHQWDKTMGGLLLALQSNLFWIWYLPRWTMMHTVSNSVITYGFDKTEIVECISTYGCERHSTKCRNKLLMLWLAMFEQFNTLLSG